MRLRNHISPSVIPLYLASELTLIDTLSARCPLAGVTVLPAQHHYHVTYSPQPRSLTLTNDDSSCKDSQESSAGNLFNNTLEYDSEGDTLVDVTPNLEARNTRPGAICYGDINLFLLRNPDNPDRDILTAELNFEILKAN